MCVTESLKLVTLSIWPLRVMTPNKDFTDITLVIGDTYGDDARGGGQGCGDGMWGGGCVDGIGPCLLYNYRVSLKKRSFTRLAPLEAPRLLIGLEISPKCYQILYIGQTYPFTHFNTIYGWFPPNYGPKYGPFKQNKFHCFRILYSTIFNNVHEKWTK